MKKFLNLLILLTLVMSISTSCRDDDYDYEKRLVPEYETKTINKGYSWKIYHEPSYSSSVKGTVEGKYGLGLLYDRKVVDGVEWLCLEKGRIFLNDRPERCWIPAKNVVKRGMGELPFEVTSRAKMMAMANQPMAHFVLNLKEQIRERWPLDHHALTISVLYSFLIWLIFFIIRFTHKVKVWHIFATFIVVVLQTIMIMTCDIFNLRGQFGDPFLDFIFGLLWLLAPLAQIWVMQALLSPILMGKEALTRADSDDDDDDVVHMPVKGHFLATLLSVIILFIIYYFNKDWVDGTIIFCAAIQLVAFIIICFTSGIKRALIYMPLFIVFALPTVYISLSSLFMTFAIFVTLALLAAPILGEGGKAANAVSCKIVNAYGQEVDQVNADGHSDQTGDNYEIDADGNARKK